ncbi:hypothetical protein [Microbacterium sp. 22296]|uniref:hypothetical protein n=1 Tax=Microbacterium sp. 22296 TaxID=3453903 RepID=UPI003F85DCB6
MSAATFWRNRTRVPHWETSVVVRLAEEGEREVQATAINRGSGVAREAKLAPDINNLMAAISASRSDQAGFGNKLTVTMAYGPEAHGTGRFLLTWRQEPNLKKLRTKRLRFKLSALPDPTTRRGRRR